MTGLLPPAIGDELAAQSGAYAKQVWDALSGGPADVTLSMLLNTDVPGRVEFDCVETMHAGWSDLYADILGPPLAGDSPDIVPYSLDRSFREGDVVTEAMIGPLPPLAEIDPTIADRIREGMRGETE